MVNYPQQVPFQRVLVRFVSTSTPIERHLLAGKQLTDTERDLIYNTVLILQASRVGSVAEKAQQTSAENTSS